MDFKFLSKAIFFPEKGILAIGDLHIGYEQMLLNEGITLPFNQLNDTKNEIELIIKNAKSISELKKIILLGDIKHHFAFDRGESFELINLFKFLENFVSRENLILIRGNHDTFTFSRYSLKDFYIEGELAFTHGHKFFPEIFEKNVKQIIIGHFHPAVVISDKPGIKKEKYKCFLAGKYKNKKVIVVPSFLPMIEGSEINEGYYEGGKFSFIPKKVLERFDAYAIGKDRTYNFGNRKRIIL